MDFTPDINGKLMVIQSLASYLPTIKDENLLKDRIAKVLELIKSLQVDTSKLQSLEENLKKKVSKWFAGSLIDPSKTPKLIQIIQEIRTVEKLHAKVSKLQIKASKWFSESSINASTINTSKFPQLIKIINEIRSIQIAAVDGQASKPAINDQEDYEGDNKEFSTECRNCVSFYYSLIKLYRQVIPEIEAGLWGKSFLEAYASNTGSVTTYFPIIVLLHSLNKRGSLEEICVEAHRIEELEREWRLLSPSRDLFPYLLEYFLRDERDFKKYSSQIPAVHLDTILKNESLWRKIYAAGTRHLENKDKEDDRDLTDLEMYRRNYKYILSIVLQSPSEEEKLFDFIYGESSLTLDDVKELYQLLLLKFGLESCNKELIEEIVGHVFSTQGIEKARQVLYWVDVNKVEEGLDEEDRNDAEHTLAQTKAKLLGVILAKSNTLMGAPLCGEFLIEVEKFTPQNSIIECVSALFFDIIENLPLEHYRSHFEPLLDKHPSAQVRFYSNKLQEEIENADNDFTVLFRCLPHLPVHLTCRILSNVKLNSPKLKEDTLNELLIKTCLLPDFDVYLIQYISAIINTRPYRLPLYSIVYEVITNLKGDEKLKLFKEVIDDLKSQMTSLDLFVKLLPHIKDIANTPKCVINLNSLAIFDATEKKYLEIFNRTCLTPEVKKIVLQKLVETLDNKLKQLKISREWENAMTFTERLMKLNPSDETIKNHYVSLLITHPKPRYQDALNFLENVCNPLIRDIEFYHYQKALCHFKLGNANEAYKLIKDYVERTTGRELIFLYISVIIELNRCEEGVPVILNRHIREPKSLDLLRCLIRLKGNLKLWDETIILIERAIAYNPNSDELVQDKLEILVQSEKYPEAIRVAKSLLNKNLRDPVALKALCDVYTRLNDFTSFAELMDLYKSHLSSFDVNTRYYVLSGLASIEYHKGNLIEALKYYSDACKISTTSSHMVAEVLYNLNRDDEAIEILLKTLKKNPHDRSSLLSLAGIYKRNDQPEKALELLDIVLEKEQSTNYILIRTDLLLFMNRDEEAMREFKRLNLNDRILKTTFQPFYLRLKGQILFIQKDYEEAKKVLVQAKEEYIKRYPNLIVFRHMKFSCDLIDSLLTKL